MTELNRRKLEMARFSVLEQLAQGQISVSQAATQMSLSYRQTLRLKEKLKTKGIDVAVHGNRGKIPSNKLSSETHRLIVDVFRDWRANTDEGVNSAHLRDILERDHGILVSRQTTWRILKSLGLQVSTRRVRKHRKKRHRREQAGDLLYLDGSPHRWFGEDHPRVTLVLCSDDATSMALHGVFVPEEDRNSCFEVAYEVFRKFGLPRAFWLDRASQFITTRGEGVHVRQTPQPTHWQNAMYLLGIQCVFAHSPQARGRGERMNGTFQDRLCAELQFRKIKSLKEATRYLNETFIPEINRRFAVSPLAADAPAWRKAPSDEDLQSILSAKTERRVFNDNTVKHRGARYQILPTAYRKSFAGREVTIEERFDRTLVITDCDRILPYEIIDEESASRFDGKRGATDFYSRRDLNVHAVPGEARCDRIAVTGM